MQFQRFIRKPSIDMLAGIKVTKGTTLYHKSDTVEQSVEKLVFHSVTKVKGENFESVYDTTIHLEEGDVLIFEAEGRGYIKPVEAFVTVKEAIEELENISDLE